MGALTDPHEHYGLVALDAMMTAMSNQWKCASENGCQFPRALFQKLPVLNVQQSCDTANFLANEITLI
jgi:hypothetical protein